MKQSTLKYIAIGLLLIYQINLSHKLLTKAGHLLSHIIEEIVTHEHHHLHEHHHNEVSDHEHRILYTFEDSFNEQSDIPPEESEKSILIKINFDKHLFSCIQTPSFFTHKFIAIRYYSEFNLNETFFDIPTPPPQSIG